ncbi:hypothetical protein [Parasphingopyxis sp.]|uniref:hypothetical protein n=1 Tax=Parasphingopyxis sp. TaxID=1920299 RepID=UPI00262A6E22|nr:hypothetical protein [Parasphingopyxis sp.]
MGTKSRVDDNHYRVTNDSGTTSWLYEETGSIVPSSKCVEVADHHDDGTTTAYEYDSSVSSNLFDGNRGSKK